MHYFEKTVASITPKDTVIYGLKYFPSLEPIVSNDQDYPAFGGSSGPELTDGNLEVVREVLSRMQDRCKVIMEIGVHRNGDRSLSHILINERPRGSIYLGVDLDDKSFLDDPYNATHTLVSNSHDQRRVRNKLVEIGASQIDILLIDGWHSVNTTVNDWCYVDLLSDHGVVILHDTNAHPGCVALFEAVDEDVFRKERHCISPDDMGIATFWHRRGGS